ncbi:C-type isolectin Sp-CL4-like isoform X1 [Dunckerocampus dactyliophorus]|uniref:C-type isolectin Sp-CL4-like isoform X1 n=1 Tax=Dunckerocampus dactyliophorus TaxID=161453 RepID=UPI00240638F8|nr:C-type isolectin Sp-CL4-like isoform X1 [Dunckerocampus dactyliophorus]XP_054626128.1 C-type isolectin Sp-CL4-like isoform X1 [Dunckerocampus dactyliophorus]
MPSAVTTVLLMGALMVVSAFAQSYDFDGLDTLCSNIELEECESDVCGVYRLNENSCVKVLTIEKDFANAEQTCRIFQGNLVKVQNADEHKKLLCMMLRLFPFRLHYWIGALRENDDFYWADGSGKVEFAPWRPGQPDRFNNEENCVWMNSGTWGPWNDVSCGCKASVACEIAM